MPSPSLTIQLFGPLRVLLHGAPIPRVRTRSVEWLLALLVLRHGRSVERSWLAGTLWPESAESKALDNLRHDLVSLRKALGQESQRIQSPTRDTLTLALEGAQVDLLAFDQAMASGDEASLHNAVEIYTGPLLEGCYEAWVSLERESREQACLTALETLADMAQERGEHAEAIRYLRKAESLDPLRDTTIRRLMTSFQATGDLASAIEVYRTFRNHLYEEMSASPDAETTRLFQQIRTQGREEGKGKREKGKEGERQKAKEESPLTSSPHHQGSPPATGPRGRDITSSAPLPHPITVLIGREEAVQELVQQVSTSRLVTLVGTGGVGKTRLSIQVASEAEEDFPHGAAFIALAPLADPALLPSFLASALGMREEGTSNLQALVQALIGWLSARPMLLVLDNCEHLIESLAALCQTLLQRCPRLHILATSRQRLGLTGEVVWRVPSLSVPDPRSLPSEAESAVAYVLNYPAVQLFVERARMVRAEFRMTGCEDAQAVAHICQRLDGIPLAIELAAARTNLLSLAQIATRLDDRFRLLTGGSRGELTRHQTLRALIDWSYDLLDESERALLCRLSIFAGGWTLEESEQICSAEVRRGKSEVRNEDSPFHSSLFPIHSSEILNLLDSLVTKSLVINEVQAGTARYHLLETVREYAQERLAKSEQEAYWLRRHLDHFLDLAEQASPQLSGPEQKEWLDRLETEHDNLRAALRFSIESEDANPEKEGMIHPSSFILHPSREVALRLAGALWAFCMMRGHVSEGRRWLQMALSAPGAEARTKARADALTGAGSLAYRQGDYEAAEASFEGSLQIYRELGNQRGIAIALHNLGVINDSRGDYGKARTFYEESLALRREMGDKRGVAGTLHNLGNITSAQGEYDAANAFFAESMAIRQEVGDRGGMAGTLHSMGTVAYSLGDYAVASTYFEQALEIRRELGDMGRLAGSLHNLGNVASRQGDYATARSRYEEALVINRAVGNRSWEATNLTNLGNLAVLQGDYSATQAYYQESLRIRQELGEKSGIAESLEEFFALAVAEGQMERAARLWGAAEALREALAFPLPPSSRANKERNIAMARATLGDAAFDAAWQEGRAFPLEQAIAYALTLT